MMVKTTGSDVDRARRCVPRHLQKITAISLFAKVDCLLCHTTNRYRTSPPLTLVLSRWQYNSTVLRSPFTRLMSRMLAC